MIVLTEEQVREVLHYDALIPAVRQAMIDLSAGRVMQPLRSVLKVGAGKDAADPGWFALMPAVHRDMMAAKLVTFYSGNSGRGLHTHHATIQLFSATTGEPLAVMDGRLITEMRTAAASAVAAELLADREARVLAILGSGVQARSHVKALSHVRTFDEIRVWSRTPENARRFADEVGGKAMLVEEAVTGADVVVTVTSAIEPVLQGRWLKSTAFVSAVGAVTPDRRELDAEAMRGPIVVESREAAEREPGDILQAGAKIAAELGELLAGKVLERNGRAIVFKSVGVAVEDLAAAKLVYDLVSAKNS